MGSLSTVEEVHFLLLIRISRRHVAALCHRFGVWDASGLAVRADSRAVPEAQEECASRRTEYIAARKSTTTLMLDEGSKAILTRTLGAPPGRGEM